MMKKKRCRDQESPQVTIGKSLRRLLVVLLCFWAKEELRKPLWGVQPAASMQLRNHQGEIRACGRATMDPTHCQGRDGSPGSADPPAVSPCVPSLSSTSPGVLSQLSNVMFEPVLTGAGGVFSVGLVLAQSVGFFLLQGRGREKLKLLTPCPTIPTLRLLDWHSAVPSEKQSSVITGKDEISYHVKSPVIISTPPIAAHIQIPHDSHFPAMPLGLSCYQHPPEAFSGLTFRYLEHFWPGWYGGSHKPVNCSISCFFW